MLISFILPLPGFRLTQPVKALHKPRHKNHASIDERIDVIGLYKSLDVDVVVAVVDDDDEDDDDDYDDDDGDYDEYVTS